MWIAHWATESKYRNMEIVGCHYTNKDGFTFFTDKYGNPEQIVYQKDISSIESKESIESYILRNKIKGLILRDNEFLPESVAYLVNFPFVESVSIYSSKLKYDCNVFNYLPNLRNLSCDLHDAVLEIPTLETLGISFGKKAVISEKCTNLQKLTIHKCKDYGSLWAQLEKLPYLEELSLNFGVMEDCSNFRILPSLKKLNFLYLKKFSDLKGIEVLADTLTSVEFATSAGKNITDYSQLSYLTKLQSLIISNNSEIKDLHFLDSLTSLEDLRLLCKISTDDLAPLKNIPQVLFFHTGIDKKIETFLEEHQLGRQNEIKNAVKNISIKIDRNT